MLEHQQLRWIRTTLLGRTPGWSPRCPPVGPWRPVWLGPALEDPISIDARFDAGVGTVACRAAIDAEACTLVVSRGTERHAIALAAAGGSWTGTLAIERPALWWPHTHGRPDRYDVVLEARRGADTRTVPLRAVGFRSIELERGERGDELGLRVNGVRVFCRGACWTPLDVVSLAATPAAHAAAVAQLCGAGMNMIRIGGTMVYEDDALYDELDAQGVLLWQDLMFANMDYPDDPAFIAGVELEVDQQLARLAGRPSLAIVCGNSEGEQQAAMWGAARELWTPRLFHEVLYRPLGNPLVGQLLGAHGTLLGLEQIVIDEVDLDLPIGLLELETEVLDAFVEEFVGVADASRLCRALPGDVGLHHRIHHCGGHVGIAGAVGEVDDVTLAVGVRRQVLPQRADDPAVDLCLGNGLRRPRISGQRYTTHGSTLFPSPTLLFPPTDELHWD